MITGIIDNTNFKFEWEQYPNAKSTLCRVINQSQFEECKEEKKNNCVVTVAIAYCSPNDEYSRREGAKISFEKVLKMLTKNKNKLDRKKFKTQAWKLFFAREDTKPSSRVVAKE